jgi:hypothetical protein
VRLSLSSTRPTLVGPVTFNDKRRFPAPLVVVLTIENRGQNTVFANILVTIRDNKPHGGDKCRANQDLSYLEFRKAKSVF